MAKKNEKGAMTFWEHLEELRWHLIRSIVAVLLLAISAFLARDILFDQILLAPSSSSFITHRLFCQLSVYLNSPGMCLDNIDLKIINIALSGQFIAHMYISVMAGLILAFPYILWEFWRFIKPALLPVEKKHSRGAVVMASSLFYLGLLFSYFLIVPLTITFLGTYQVSLNVENQIALRSYINTVMSLSFAVGLVFELPIVVYFLTKIGVLTPHLMKNGRKIALILILLISAIITPADIFSMIMVAIPLYLLFEISITISARASRKISLPDAV
ncbi:MAG: twin-arginine translocase subunit TatC [Bacteroidia bacterium]|jgi:sec-independent protein translocase protein TatC|nr:twin-arginine translocase subunit TatC [Bacteroidales bacterium]MDD3011977.1 twin-arginine translocase subunit TatC [Bacteroidales bacterium]MDD3962054.1 twin-arginine translocase subunit TatC [Bacteroidales bacterium]MDY0286491.1 twin-arginine translocase subunit TatC [Bacteroidales bacterium]NCD41886.1 twin-arginine translocase subunit TatC [Bacteroidia bacterium]